MKNYAQLINNVTGQLNGIKKMMDSQKDCFEVLTQIKAAKSALNSLTNKFLQENFIKCLNKCDSNNAEKEALCKKFFTQIIN